MPKHASDHPALTPELRWAANMLCLWGLCGKSACRREQACKGEPRLCLARYAPLTPELAREGVKRMFDGRRFRMSYEMLHEEAPDEVEAVEEWTALVRASARPLRGGGEGR